MKEILTAIVDAYSLLDKCITKLLKGRINKDKELEQEAYCDMEYAVNGTMQNLAYLYGRLKGETLNEWIKVEDKSPRVDEQILVYYHNYKGQKFISVGHLTRKNGKLYFNLQNEGELILLEFCDYWQEIVPPKED